MKRFFFRTLGCKVNQYETEAMEELFLKRGYDEAKSEEDCDVYVVNTCTVTATSDAKSRQQINRIKKKNPDAVVAVVGCYSQIAPEVIESMEHVDIILGTKGRSKIVDMVESFKENGKRIIEVGDVSKNRTFDELSITTEMDMTRAYIKIQEGCDMFCTYCIIPYARGHIASRKLGAIIVEAKTLAQNGFKEIVLTGIHVASYGKDQGGKIDLIDVIEEIAKIPGIERIRLSSIEPRWVTTEKLLRLKATGKFCDHFHLSLQSGCDKILKSMNRHYDTKIFSERIDLIREVFPDCGITTDVIVGFPDETEDDLNKTIEFCKKIGFSRIHIFPYSQRTGTPAAIFKNQVSPEIKKKRVSKLEKVEETLRFNFLEEHIGKIGEVLFENETNDLNTMTGYTRNYIRVEAKRDENRINKVSNVLFMTRDGDKLFAEVID